MRSLRRFVEVWCVGLMLIFAALVHADDPTTPARSGPWKPETMGEAILSTVIFGLIGIVLAMIGFKLMDWLTPGSMDREILEKQNIAASILGAAIILGVCIIIAAAVL